MIKYLTLLASLAALQLGEGAYSTDSCVWPRRGPDCGAPGFGPLGTPLRVTREGIPQSTSVNILKDRAVAWYRVVNQWKAASCDEIRCELREADQFGRWPRSVHKLAALIVRRSRKQRLFRGSNAGHTPDGLNQINRYEYWQPYPRDDTFWTVKPGLTGLHVETVVNDMSGFSRYDRAAGIDVSGGQNFEWTDTSWSKRFNYGNGQQFDVTYRDILDRDLHDYVAKTFVAQSVAAATAPRAFGLAPFPSGTEIGWPSKQQAWTQSLNLMVELCVRQQGKAESVRLLTGTDKFHIDGLLAKLPSTRNPRDYTPLLAATFLGFAVDMKGTTSEDDPTFKWRGRELGELAGHLGEGIFAFLGVINGDFVFLTGNEGAAKLREWAPKSRHGRAPTTSDLKESGTDTSRRVFEGVGDGNIQTRGAGAGRGAPGDEAARAFAPWRSRRSHRRGTAVRRRPRI